MYRSRLQLITLAASFINPPGIEPTSSWYKPVDEGRYKRAKLRRAMRKASDRMVDRMTKHKPLTIAAKVKQPPRGSAPWRRPG